MPVPQQFPIKLSISCNLEISNLESEKSKTDGQNYGEESARTGKISINFKRKLHGEGLKWKTNGHFEDKKPQHRRPTLGHKFSMQR